MKDLADAIVIEEARQVIASLSQSAAVFYTGFGGGGGDGFGSGSSFGSSSFGSAPRSPSSIGSGGARISDYGYGPGSPDYKMDPAGPLSAPEHIKIEPIKMDLSFQLPEATQSPFKLDLDIGKMASSILGPSVPSRFGAPKQDDYSSALFEAATRGMPKVPSSLGSGGEKFGLTTGEKFKISYNLPEVKLQLHLHGSDETTISHGHIVDYNHKPIKDLSGFEASIAASIAESLGFKKSP